MSFDTESITDEEFKELFNVANSNGIIDKNIRKEILGKMIDSYIEEHTIKELVKIITDCVPTGYVARVILKLKRNI